MHLLEKKFPNLITQKCGFQWMLPNALLRGWTIYTSISSIWWCLLANMVCFQVSGSLMGENSILLSIHLNISISSSTFRIFKNDLYFFSVNCCSFSFCGICFLLIFNSSFYITGKTTCGLRIINTCSSLLTFAIACSGFTMLIFIFFFVTESMSYFYGLWILCLN